MEGASAHAGVRLELVGMAELGAVNGAVFVRWPDGRDGVLTRVSEPVDQLTHTAEILDLARARGVPVPRYDLVAAIGTDTVIVQERLPGAPTPRHVDLPMIEAVIALTESFTGVLRDRPDIPTIDLRLRQLHGDDGIPRFDSLARYDNRSQRLLAWIGEVDDAGHGDMPGDDLLNRDFSRDNILFDAGGELTGIVDWHTTLRRGDRGYCLLNLRFDLAWALLRNPPWNTIDPDALHRLDEAINAIETDTLRLYWAHQSLDIVDALIRTSRQHPEWHHEVDAVLNFAMQTVQ